MKELIVLMRSEQQDRLAAQFIRNNLIDVLEDTVHITLAFLADPIPPDYSAADLILVPIYNMIRDIHELIHDDSNKILFVSRTLSKEITQKIQAIPAGEDVLVMNRSHDTTMDMMAMLYQLGMIHLNLYPYTESTCLSDYRYIVTTNGADLTFPPEATTIDVGFRQLDTQAFLDIFSKLDLESERMTVNLTRYIQTLPQKHTDVEHRYLTTLLTNQILRTVLEISDFGVVATDLCGKIIYCNRQVNIMFSTDLCRGDLFTVPANVSCQYDLFSPNFSQELLQVGNEYIMIQRHDLTSGSEPIGLFFECRTASSIRKMDTHLNQQLRKSGLYARYSFRDIIATSPQMKECLTVAQKLAKTNYAILISGESGSGKELFAQSIHNASPNANGPFVAVNCAAFPEQLLESELFGYEGGAFTGSRKEGKVGLFELANNGSIFLDEIGDMPLSLQAKLLRVLQEKKVMRVGSSRVIDVNIRVISASNKDLKQEIQNNRFRADLYYRLSTFTIDIPPLRYRTEDILPLFYIFAANSKQSLTATEKQQLLHYFWPGNVRELQNVAAYYNVIGNLSVLKLDSKPQVSQIVSQNNNSTPQEQILSILRRNPREGMGRHRIMNLLRENGSPISENRFEALIRQMVADGLVQRGRGRAGIRLCSNSDE